MKLQNPRRGKSFLRRSTTRKSSGSVGVVFAVFFLIVLLGILLVAFWPRHKIYTLDISTEIVSFVITDPRYSEWDLSGASAYLDPFSDMASELEEASFLELNRGVKVELQRHANGPLRIKLERNEGSVGLVGTPEGNRLELDSWVVFKIPMDEVPLVLPFRGFLTIGDDVASLVDSILLTGRISIVEEKLFTRGHYTAGEEVLDAGDRVQLWSYDSTASGRSASRLDGFVRASPHADASEPLKLIAHGQADYARIKRFGSAGYEVRTQAWVRFINDPILGVLFAVLASLALILELFFKLIELRKTMPIAAKKQDEETGND